MYIWKQIHHQETVWNHLEWLMTLSSFFTGTQTSYCTKNFKRLSSPIYRWERGSFIKLSKLSSALVLKDLNSTSQALTPGFILQPGICLIFQNSDKRMLGTKSSGLWTPQQNSAEQTPIPRDFCIVLEGHHWSLLNYKVKHHPFGLHW